MIEIGSVFRPYAQAMVVSEESTNWEGLQYDKFIGSLQKYPGWAAEQLANNMAATAKGDGCTYSSVNLDARSDNLVTAVDEWSLALIAGLPRNRARYDTARADTQSVWGYTAWDLYDAARQVKKQVRNTTIKAKSQAVMDAVTVAVGYNWFRPGGMWGWTYTGMHGLTIFWPKWKASLNPSWTKPWSSSNNWTFYATEIPFSAQTHWDEFLVKYARKR